MAPLPSVFSAVFRVAAVAAPIVGRALIDAYKQAMINAQAGGAARQTVLKNSKMSRDEALKILNVEKAADIETIKQKYKILFDSNDPSRGGSKYLQSKIEVAHRILSEGHGSEAKQQA
uniref:Mitochondrial import inner membrane translocase subunit TIM16 n=1 Tax=Hanusia phi TaxID=3032 RepID=A0A7S0DWC2_9CRYP|mmetsp:Transcript_11142/g.25248  ORF Transcript_11142/g.25248 Transcript_11142/m.25248 type:complete len:118 (+) Transcript_11142:209-562(+)